MRKTTSLSSYIIADFARSRQWRIDNSNLAPENVAIASKLCIRTREEIVLQSYDEAAVPPFRSFFECQSVFESTY
jgi:hypothetical protein